MLKNNYDIDTTNFKCNKKYKNLINKYGKMWIQFDVYYTLNDFINDYKQYYCTKRQQKIDDILNPLLSWEIFNDIFSDFINVYLHEWKIGKNENVSIYKYDDYIVVYTKNNSFSYVWYE